MDRVLRKGGLRRGFLLASAGFSLCYGIGGVLAQESAAPGTVTNLIVANLAKPKAICGAVRPVIESSPGAFSELIDASKSYPDLLEPLGECCAVIQTSLKKTDPAAAKEVSEILVAGPASFQAACAVSLADQQGGQAYAASGGTDGGTGTSGVGYGGGWGGGGTIGGGGGTVSPASP